MEKIPISIFSKLFAQGPCGVKTPLGPLTKILDPPLVALTLQSVSILVP